MTELSALLQQKTALIAGASESAPALVRGRHLFFATRAAHLSPYITLMREIGVPVDKHIRKSGLAEYLEESPDYYLPLHLGLDFVGGVVEAEAIPEIGHLASQLLDVSNLHPKTLDRLLAAATLHGALSTFVENISIEETSLTSSMRREHNRIRVYLHNFSLKAASHYYLAEWLQVMVFVKLARYALGRRWAPPEMTFRSQFPINDEASNEFPNTRILVGQPFTTILLPESDLLAPTTAFLRLDATARRLTTADSVAGDLNPDNLSVIDLLREVLRPYLHTGTPPVQLAADIAGISVRTLQRVLAKHGQSYSGLVNQIRFENAVALMRDPDLKMIDIAMSVGFDDPAHFSRAFRNYAGTSPRAFRRQHLAQANA